MEIDFRVKAVVFVHPLCGRMDVASKNPVPCATVSAKSNQNHVRFHPTPAARALAICDMPNDESIVSCQLMSRACEETAEVSVRLIGSRRG
jgi:hypothetical protein